MFRLLMIMVFISLVIAPSTAQPTNPPITPDNIAQLEEQYMLGRGSISNISYTPDGEHLLVATPLGLWRYDAQDLSAEPELQPTTGRLLGYYLDGRYMVFYPDRNTNQFYVLDSQTESRIFEGSSGFYGFSADGEHVITNNWESDVNYYDIWEIATGEKIETLQYESFSETLLTPENTRIVIELPYEDGVYWVWDRENHTLSPSFTGDEQFFMDGAIFSPDGTRFITHDDRWAYLWDAITGTMMKRLAQNEDSPIPLDAVSLFTPDSRYALTGGHYQTKDDFSVHLYDAVTGDFIRGVATRGGGDLIFSPDGKYLITEQNMGYTKYQFDNYFYITRTDTWEMVSQIKGVKHDVIFNPNGQDMLIKNTSLSRYELSTGTFLDAIRGHYWGASLGTSILFSPDDTLFLIADAQIHLWNPQTGEFLQELSGKGSNLDFRFSPDATYLMNVTYEGDINVWETATGQLLHTKINYRTEGDYRTTLHDMDTADPFHGAMVSSQNPSFSPDETTYITTLWDTLYLRDTVTGDLIHEQKISEYHDIAYQARFNPTGTHITVITQGGMMEWWNINTWVMDYFNPAPHRWEVISPDGAYVAYAVENEIWLFDTQTGENRLFSDTYRGHITYLAFSPNGQELYSGADGELSKIWDVTTGEFIRTGNYYGSSADGRLALTNCEGDAVMRYCVMDAQTEERLFVLEGHVGDISYARFNHAGTQIVTTGSDGTIRLWGVGD
jgi:WD40 repeat protein